MATSVRSVPSALYEGDFTAWAEAQAEALRTGRLDALDLEHLAEEIGDLSNRERDALESHLETLFMHLLKWRYQPDQRSRSWEATIKVARRNIAKLLRRSPSLRRDCRRHRRGLSQCPHPGGRCDRPRRRCLSGSLPLHPGSGHRRLDALRRAQEPS